MSRKFKFISLSALLISFCLIVACSSSTSSSGGSGQIPTGQYTGNLNGQVRVSNTQAGAVSTRIILNVVTAVGDGAITSISGNMIVTGGDRCWTGGTINGGSGTTTGGGSINTETSFNHFRTKQNIFDNVIDIFISPVHAQSSVTGNQMILAISTNEGTTLTMTGRVTDDSYSGTFTTADSRCGTVSGGFDLSRV